MFREEIRVWRLEYCFVVWKSKMSRILTKSQQKLAKSNENNVHNLISCTYFDLYFSPGRDLYAKKKYNRWYVVNAIITGEYYVNNIKKKTIIFFLFNKFSFIFFFVFFSSIWRNLSIYNFYLHLCFYMVFPSFFFFIYYYFFHFIYVSELRWLVWYNFVIFKSFLFKRVDNL